ncbi:large ribosomal subunit protein eL20-like [Lycium ferocissimum]|uniref:large ribosomal subunit protein eL20-like n=1 Tax=Lycium ferocissimum TaxID=112874 RepID=UPI0028153E7A|nr:large ribosomal subunit protein eL20-like [Lycium ferocissimum]
MGIYDLCLLHVYYGLFQHKYRMSQYWKFLMDIGRSATNEVHAKSKFWYFLRELKKVKKRNGQMLAINEIFEKNRTKIKNYGIWLRYQSRIGYHNMYKEYRDTTLNGGVE